MKMKVAILAGLSVLPYEIVALPEVDAETSVRVSVMTAAERDEFDAKWLEMRKGEGGAKESPSFRALMTVYCVRDVETGERLFGLEDLPAVRALNSVALSRLADTAFRLNKLNASVEDEEKNS